MPEIFSPNGYGCRLSTEHRAVSFNIYFGYDYMSPTRSITGDIETAEHQLRFGSGDQQTVIQAGQKYLGISFNREIFRIAKGNYSDVKENLIVGCLDFLHLLSTLNTKKKLKDIQVITGETNRELAKIAVNKLGFHFQARDAKEIEQSLKDPGSTIFIYGKVCELEDRIPFINETLSRLTSTSPTKLSRGS